MAEVIGIIAAIGSITHLLVSARGRIQEFVQAVKNVDEVVRGLQVEVDGVIRVLGALKEVLLDPLFSAITDSGSDYTKRKRILETLKSSVLDVTDAASSFQDRFARFVEPKDRTRSNFWSRSTRHVRLDLAQDDISKLRAQLHTHHLALQVSLQLVNVYVSATAPRTILNELFPQFRELQQAITRLQEHGDQNRTLGRRNSLHDETDDPESTTLELDLEFVIKDAISVIETSTTSRPSSSLLAQPPGSSTRSVTLLTRGRSPPLRFERHAQVTPPSESAATSPLLESLDRVLWRQSQPAARDTRLQGIGIGQNLFNFSASERTTDHHPAQHALPEMQAQLANAYSTEESDHSIFERLRKLFETDENDCVAEEALSNAITLHNLSEDQSQIIMMCAAYRCSIDVFLCVMISWEESFPTSTISSKILLALVARGIASIDIYRRIISHVPTEEIKQERLLLVAATKLEDSEIVELLLTYEAPPDPSRDVDNLFERPLMQAVKRAQRADVRLLLEWGAKVDEEVLKSATLVPAATGILQLLQSQCGKEMRGSILQAITYCVGSGSPDALDNLEVLASWDTELIHDYGQFLIVEACTNDNDFELLDMLFEKGATIEQDVLLPILKLKFERGRPSTGPAYRGDKSSIRLLVDHGASPSATELSGEALILSCIAPHRWRYATALLQAGAWPVVETKDSPRISLLIKALQVFRNDPETWHEQSDVITFMTVLLQKIEILHFSKTMKLCPVYAQALSLARHIRASATGSTAAMRPETAPGVRKSPWDKIIQTLQTLSARREFSL